MEFEFEFSRVNLVLLFGSVVLLFGAFFVYAYNSGGPASTKGHSGEEIEVDFDGEIMTLNEAFALVGTKNLDCMREIYDWPGSPAWEAGSVSCSQPGYEVVGGSCIIPDLNPLPKTSAVDDPSGDNWACGSTQQQPGNIEIAIMCCK